MATHSSRTEIKQLPESKHDLWDDLIQSSCQGTVFHKFDWLKIMEKYTNTKLILLIGLIGEEIFGAIPLFLQETFSGLIRRLLSPPYPTMVPYLGPVFVDYDSLKEDKREYRLRCFQMELDRFLHSRIRPHSMSAITPPYMLDMRHFLEAGYSVVPNYAYIADVTDLKAVWKGFKRKLRENIRKAEKNGLEVEEAALSGYNLVTRLLSRRIEEKGQRMDVSAAYLVEVYRKLHPRNLKIFVCKYGEDQIGGIVFTPFKERVTLWLAAARALKGVPATDLLYWATIKWASTNGFRLCEISVAESQVRFKAKYNFSLIPYYSAKKMRKSYGFFADKYNALRSFVQSSFFQKICPSKKGDARGQL